MKEGLTSRWSLVIVLCVSGWLLTGAVVIGAQEYTLEPTPLEAMATRPDAITWWSSYIGRLDGGTAHASVFAVTIESLSSTPSTMSGVRIELRGEGVRRSCDIRYVEWSVLCAREQAAIYIEEDRLDDFRSDVLRGHAEVHPGHSMGVNRSTGGMMIGGYTLRDSTFAEFADLLADASAALEVRPLPTDPRDPRELIRPDDAPEPAER